MTMLIVRKFLAYGLMAAFILGSVAVVGGVGHMLTVFNAVCIVIAGLGLAYVVDGQLKTIMTKPRKETRR
jgi:hypothetical protein